MIVDLLFIIIGLSGLVFSSDKFVDGAANLALNLKMSSLLVGILVIGVGTSAPEIIVSASAALEGSDLALGNAIGSNISNIALIIGITSLLSPIVVKKSLLKKEFILLIISTVLGSALLIDGSLSFYDAIILFIGLILVLYFLIRNAKKPKIENIEIEENPEMSLKKSILFTLGGIISLIAFSKLLVFGAISLATSLGINDVIIGLTIVAIGTSLPELSACIAAARKGKSDLAIGNVIGSNIFNILAVLSISGFIYPMNIPSELLTRDIPFMIILTFLFFIFSRSKEIIKDGVITRFKGLFFILLFIIYIFFIILETMNLNIFG